MSGDVRVPIYVFFNHGGLDSRDPHGLCRDQFLKPVEIDFYFISVEIFKIKTFSSRLRCVEIFIKIVEANRDFRDYSRLFETNQDFSRYL